MNGDRETPTDEYTALEPAVRTKPPYSFSTLVRVDLAARSHQGRVRPNNEDRYLVVRGGRFLHTLMTNLEEGQVPHEFGDTVWAMAVADGMGGMAAGEVASRMALSTLVSLVLDTPDWIFSHEEPQVERILNRSAGRFRDVNQALIEETRRDPRLAGMGTTLTLAFSIGADLFVTHVGDSRVYLCRQGALYRLTRDHTLAQALVEAGTISPEEVSTHRLRHVLTQALGVGGGGGKPEVQRLGLADGDRLLLCTDGLTDMVEDETIKSELQRGTSADAACRALLDLALQRGGKDNVTVVVAGYRIPTTP
jgi:protein phosphatase